MIGWVITCIINISYLDSFKKKRKKTPTSNHIDQEGPTSGSNNRNLCNSSWISISPSWTQISNGIGSTRVPALTSASSSSFIRVWICSWPNVMLPPPTIEIVVAIFSSGICGVFRTTPSPECNPLILTWRWNVRSPFRIDGLEANNDDWNHRV